MPSPRCLHYIEVVQQDKVFYALWQAVLQALQVGCWCAHVGFAVGVCWGLRLVPSAIPSVVCTGAQLRNCVVPRLSVVLPLIHTTCKVKRPTWLPEAALCDCPACSWLTCLPAGLHGSAA